MPNLILVVLASSAALQTIAAIICCRLIFVARPSYSWALAAAAMALMCIHSGTGLYEVLAGAQAVQPVGIQELIVLAFSTLMLAGLVLTVPYIRNLSDTNRKLDGSRKRLELLLETSPDAILLIHLPDFIITYANKRAFELFEATPDEFIGRNATDFSSSAQRFSERVDLIITMEKSYQWEADCRTAKGRNFSAISSGIKFSDQGEEYVQSTIVDISLLKETEKALRESRAQFQGLFEQSPISTQIFDSEGIIQLVNPAYEEMWGLNLEMMRGYNILNDLQTLEIAGDGLQRAFSGEPVVDFPPLTYDARPLGRGSMVKRNIAARAYSIRDSSGTLTHVVIMHIDMTERLQAEEQLRQAQKMEAVGQLTGGVAHDFNNLLAVILGNLDLVIDSAHKAPAIDQHLQSAISAAEKGAKLVQQLLAFSRSQPLVPKRLNIRDSIAEIVKLLHRTLGEQIEIETVFSTDIWHCMADPTQLESALLNLAVNARDAMPEGGKLTIESSNIWLGEEYAATHTEVDPGPYVMLAVTDTGTGIPDDILAKVVDPFFSTKAPKKGTGLGLSMVFGFAKQSGGHMSIYSEEGHGTSVKLYLPRSADDAVAISKTPDPTSSHTTRRYVLLVEDDPDVRQLTATMLRDLGNRVEAAEDGNVALGILRAQADIDLLLTDVMLPGGLSGPQTAKAAQKIKPGLKVLYMSGYTENAILHQGKLDEGVVLLQKPFRRADLVNKIGEALAQV